MVDGWAGGRARVRGGQVRCWARGARLGEGGGGARCGGRNPGAALYGIPCMLPCWDHLPSHSTAQHVVRSPAPSCRRPPLPSPSCAPATTTSPPPPHDHDLPYPTTPAQPGNAVRCCTGTVLYCTARTTGTTCGWWSAGLRLRCWRWAWGCPGSRRSSTPRSR